MWEIRNKYILPTIPDRPAFVSELGGTYDNPLRISRAGLYTNIIEKYYKEGYLMSEVIERLKEILAEVEAEKAGILAVDVEVEVAAKLDEVKEHIREEVLKVRDEKIKDLDLRHLAVEHLIEKEVAKLAVEEEVVVEGE